MIRKLATVAVAAVLFITMPMMLGAAAAPRTPDLHRQCAELIWADGGRVVTPSGDRAPASFEELLDLPLHCPELGTNELLHPQR